MTLLEILKKTEFSNNGYCPICGGWEIRKGWGCSKGLHTTDCNLQDLIFRVQKNLLQYSKKSV